MRDDGCDLAGGNVGIAVGESHHLSILAVSLASSRQQSASPSIISRHSGAARSAEPGIHNPPLRA
jgi:hypothetical protein